MNVAMYLRVSTDEQRDIGTIETQREELLRYCEREGHAVVVVCEDNGVSGSVPLEERPGGKALLDAVKRGAVAGVVAYKLDRLGREAFDVLATISFFKARGVRLLSPSEEYADTSAGSLYTGMRAVIAQFEKELIRERTTAGKNRKARNGAWWGGPCPLGYEPGEEFALVPSAKADVVRRVFEWAGRDGMSLNEIARRLGAMEILPARGKRWHSAVIRLILVNPTYRGELIYGRSGHAMAEPVILRVPAIVDDNLWHAAQRTLATNRADKSGRPSLIYELAGLMRCFHCGAPYTGGIHGGQRGPNGVGYPYYTCRNKGRCPNSRSVKKDIAEKRVWEKVKRFLQHPNEVLDELARRARGVTDNNRHQELYQLLRDQIAAKADERQRAIALCTQGIITPTDLARQMERIGTQKKELEAQLEAAEEDVRNAELIEAGLSRIELALRSFRDGDLPLTPEGRKRLIKTLVESIEIETISLGDSRGRNSRTLLHTSFVFDQLTTPVREVQITRPYSKHLSGTLTFKRTIDLEAK